MPALTLLPLGQCRDCADEDEDDGVRSDGFRYYEDTRYEDDWSDEEGYYRAGVYTEGKRPTGIDLSGGANYYDPNEDTPFSGLTHGDGEWADEMAEKTAALPLEERSWPPSFSKIRDLDVDDAELKQKFPLFPGKALARDITVNEGASLPTIP